MFDREGPSLRELLHQAMVSTEDGYDLIAPKFEHTPFRTPDEITSAMAGAMGPFDDGLDVCCGTGAALLHLRKRARRRVVGLDFSQGMLDEAARRAAAAHGAPVELVRGDALAMRFDAEFDVVTSVGAFGHILRADEPAFLDGIFRALRPGGEFVFVTSEVPRMTSPWFWAAHGFNAAMRVRNALWKPEFIMYYLTFCWPDVRATLLRSGFDVTMERDRFPKPWTAALLVRARKPHSTKSQIGERRLGSGSSVGFSGGSAS
ncbi:class I SAM-dependent methyltransferase [soil metagenome]